MPNLLLIPTVLMIQYGVQGISGKIRPFYSEPISQITGKWGWQSGLKKAGLWCGTGFNG
jgi:hypothetical protein